MDKPVVHVPDLCRYHAHELVVHRLQKARRRQLPESGPWQLAMIVMEILLFQWAAKDPAIWVADLTLVFAEIGCLACRYPDGFDAAVRVMLKGIDHAVAVSRGQISDPDWLTLTAPEVH